MSQMVKLGPKLIKLLSELAAVRQYCPALHEALSAAAAAPDRQAHMHVRADPHYDGVSGGQRMSLVGLLHGAPGGDLAGGPRGRGGAGNDAARRTSNREKCRDAFFGLVKEASGLVAGLAGPGAMEGLMAVSLYTICMHVVAGVGAE